MLPSGKEPVFHNRVRWAIFYLRKAGLVSSAGRGIIQLTAAGKQFIRTSPSDTLDIKALENISAFQDWKHSSKEPGVEAQPSVVSSDRTPEERMEDAYQELNQKLESDLLEQVKAVSPGFFERLVVDLLTAMGYGGSIKDAGSAIGRTGDGGIDGIIKEDKLGLDAIYLQAKRWEGTVGRPEIQKFAGALAGNRAKKGVFLTTSSFTSEAEEFVRSIDSKIVLINGKLLAQLMVEHGVGVSDVVAYTIKQVDRDFFVDE